MTDLTFIGLGYIAAGVGAGLTLLGAGLALPAAFPDGTYRPGDQGFCALHPSFRQYDSRAHSHTLLHRLYFYLRFDKRGAGPGRSAGLGAAGSFYTAAGALCGVPAGLYFHIPYRYLYRRGDASALVRMKDEEEAGGAAVSGL